MGRTLIILLTSTAILMTSPAFAQNRVLSLDGDEDEDYVEMADSGILGNVGSQVTVEVWIKPTELTAPYAEIVAKEDESGPPDWGDRSYVLQLTDQRDAIHLVSSPSGQGQIGLDSQSGSIVANTWYHVAGIVDIKNGVMKISINGSEVARRVSGPDIHISSLPLLIGRGFAGQMDELRIWNIARTQEQIQATMFTSLSGKEPGLIGYWRFDDVGDTATDSSPNGISGKLVGDAHLVEARIPGPDEFTILSGAVTDESGQPFAEASIRLEQDGEEVSGAQSDDSGSYRIAILNLADGLYDLSATHGEYGDWRLSISLSEGDSRTVNLTLRKVTSIEGTLLMPDNKTPHVAVPVQAIRDGKAAVTVLSDSAGKYGFMNLKPGEYQVRCQILGGYVYYGDGKVGTRHGVSLRVEPGKALGNIDFRFPPFKKGVWRNYDQTDGLAHAAITSIYRASDGEMWFGTGTFVSGNGVSRYDGEKFTNFATEDGLADNWVTAIHGTSDGVIWFGTGDNGISRYDGREFVSFTTEDGLADDRVYAILCADDGTTWFGTEGGISRYDGAKFHKPITFEDGLVDNRVRAIYRDPDGVMWFGTVEGVSRYDGETFVNFTARDGLAYRTVRAICRDPDGAMWFGTGGGVSRYEGGEFTNFTVEDGLIHNNVRAIYCAPDGVIWIGTEGGVSRYDGKSFTNFTTEDGLIHNDVTAIQGTADGAIWFGTSGQWMGGGGVSRYDENGVSSFNTVDGLAHNRVLDIYLAEGGVMWIGTQGGISRYDGEQFFSFPEPEGRFTSINSDSSGVLWAGATGDACFRYDGTDFVRFASVSGIITVIHRAPDGAMWIGTWGRGVYRYDGEDPRLFTKEGDGLADDLLYPSHVIDTDADGVLWLGTQSGISRYDGAKFHEPLTVEDGLVDNRILAVHCVDDGSVWFGTMNGISRYDGRGMGDFPHFTNFTARDGLAANEVRAIHRDPDGMMWFGTSSGVSLYDGSAWSSLDARDGLAGSYVVSILQDSEGFLLFGTEGGLTRYRRNATPPHARIISVSADRTYTDLSAIPEFSVGTRVTVEYSSIDFKTIPEKRQYRCRVHKTQDARLKTQDEELRTQESLESGVWDLGSSGTYNPPTRNTTFDWIPRKSGAYTFQVQAIDRDLNYSEPASIELTVVQPFYLRAVFLIPTISSGMILLATVVILGTALTKRRRQVHAYQLAAVQELQDAREMQMLLLPEAAPPVEGMEIAGRSIPANTVGGDFFDYLALADGKVGIALADVSGKGLRAAMNATMTNGMMHEVATIEASCGSILSRLNAHLHPLMEKQMFTAFSLAILDQDAGAIQWSNAGQPLPLTKRSDGASEAAEHGELPLGMAPDVRYPDYELKLQPGDIVIFYTDGIIEAENSAEEIYGIERLLNLVTGIDSSASAEDVIEAILRDVADFVGTAEQYDDMTIVVVKKVASAQNRWDA